MSRKRENQVQDEIKRIRVRVKFLIFDLWFAVETSNWLEAARVQTEIRNTVKELRKAAR
jgi:hypothetical protein